MHNPAISVYEHQRIWRNKTEWQSEHIGQWATPHHRRLGGIGRVVPIEQNGFRRECKKQQTNNRLHNQYNITMNEHII